MIPLPGLGGDASQGLIRLVYGKKEKPPPNRVSYNGLIRFPESSSISRITIVSVYHTSNKLPRIMFHISYRLTLLMRSPESCHDSGKLISSVIRYDIWNMIQGILLDDMKHDSEFLCSSGAHET